MTKSRISLTEEQEKEVIEYYLTPSSMKDTVKKFNLTNRYQLQKILDKYGIPQHTQDIKKQLQRQNAETTCLKRYGVKCNFASKDPKLNGKRGMLEKYGVEYPYQSLEIFNKVLTTKEQRYGDKNYNNAEKMHKTCEEIYGGIGFASEALREKVLNTCEKRYNSRTYNNREQASETFLRKYGTAHAPKSIYKIDNVSFDSFPELCFYLYYKKINKNIQRIVDPFTYECDGKTWKYFPDFKIDDTVYELKGDQFLDTDNNTWKNPFKDEDKKARAKHDCAIANNVVILYSKDYQKYINWYYLQGYKREDFKV